MPTKTNNICTELEEPVDISPKETLSVSLLLNKTKNKSKKSKIISLVPSKNYPIKLKTDFDTKQ